MSDVNISTITEISDPGLRAFAEELADGVILAASRAVACHVDPKTYRLPKDKDALEHHFLRVLRARPLERQTRLADRVMPLVRGKQLRLQDRVDLGDTRGAFEVATAAAKLKVGSKDVIKRRPSVQDDSDGVRQQDAVDRLAFYMKAVKCVIETEGFMGSHAGSDEIAIGGAVIDAGGNVGMITQRTIGEFSQKGVVKNIDPSWLLGECDFRSGTGWPKTFSLALALGEIDNGNFSALIQRLFTEMQAKTKDAAKGLSPAAVVDAIAGAIQYVLTKVFQWLKDLWEDDVFPGQVYTLTFNSADDRFYGRSATSPIGVDFKGHGGHYRVWFTAHLLLESELAQQGGVTVFDGPNFTGKSRAFGVGRHDMSKLAASGIANDSISSLKLGRGLRVIAYENEGYTGTARVYTGDQAALQAFNDKISSIVVEPMAVTIFEHANFGGRSQSFGPGRWDLGKIQIGNDAVSSVLVAPGLKVTLFEHNLFQGRSKVFVASPTSYVGDDFNDAVSSLIVEYI